VINLRLAMVGFVNIVAHEVAYGEGVATQVQQLDAPTLLALSVWVAASLIPILKGVRNNEAFGETHCTPSKSWHCRCCSY
jgi:hypothetical protein